jgi:membrane-associated phospholipid phosphatase
MSAATATYSVSYFAPLVLSGMAYSVKDTQLLVKVYNFVNIDTRLNELLCSQSAPPYVVAVISAMILSYFSDRTRLRAPFLIAQAALSVIGISMTVRPIPAYLSFPNPGSENIRLTLVLNRPFPLSLAFGSSSLLPFRAGFRG